MTRGMLCLALACVFAVESGCSVYKASTQPGPADLTGIGVGTPRMQVITRIGAPKFSDTDPQGRRQDTFEFQSGFHQASKARVILYLAADVFTIGLAELILWPLEMTVMDSASCIAMASYDPAQRVDTWALSKKDGTQGC